MRTYHALTIHAVNIFLIVVSAVLLNSFFCYKEYTLYENGNWISSKTKTEKGLLSAWTTMLSKPTISQNHLNIAAWSGYQEMIYKTPLKFDAISFHCKCYGHAFSFIVNKTDTSSTGIYFNYSKDSCCYFKTDAEGKFVQRQCFATNGALHNKEWNEIECKIGSGSINVLINKHVYTTLKSNLPNLLYIGFRGSRETVYIDDIATYHRHQKNLTIDNFTPPFSVKWPALVFMILAIFCYWALYKKNALNFALLNFVITSGILFYYLFYYYYLSGLYTTQLAYKAWGNANMKLELTDSARERIKREYPIIETTHSTPSILFVGSSQTWGSGVTNINQTYPNRIKELLKNYFGDTSIAVINTGIQGATSDKLLLFYKSDWIKYKPILTVIDLSFNDCSNAEVFRKSIRGFIELNNSQHIKTLLVFEPCDTLTNCLFTNHQIMRFEAQRAGIPFMDMQSYLDSHTNDGFIWWDCVHMTDFGYHLFAEGLTRPIIEIIQADAKQFAVNKKNDLPK